MKKSILIVHQRQFGHHTGSLQYCQQLKNDYNISFICWDYRKKIIKEPGVTVIYITRDGNIFSRNLRFIRGIIKCVKQQKFNLIFIHYFRGCSLIPLFCKKDLHFHLDIRTGSISVKRINRIIYNLILLFESFFFKRISIISEGLREHLKIKKSAYILPLGANPIYINRKKNNGLNLLYIGTLSNRNLEATIKGFHIFLKKNMKTKIHYTIVGGDGKNGEIQKLQKIIDELDLSEYINLTGYIPYNDLLQFYESSNIGVSFIPITSYYDYQPPTKTFEYLMSGMPVIATDTYENRNIVKNFNGVLIKDTPESFAKGLSEVNSNMNTFDPVNIRKSVESYEWNRIIKTMKETILQ